MQTNEQSCEKLGSNKMIYIQNCDIDLSYRVSSQPIMSSMSTPPAASVRFPQNADRGRDCSAPFTEADFKQTKEDVELKQMCIRRCSCMNAHASCQCRRWETLIELEKTSTLPLPSMHFLRQLVNSAGSATAHSLGSKNKSWTEAAIAAIILLIIVIAYTVAWSWDYWWAEMNSDSIQWAPANGKALKGL